MAEKKNANTEKATEMMTIRLPKKRGEDAKFVGIDGVSYLVKRGIDVEVPKAVYDEIMRAEAAETRAEEKAETLAASE